MSARLRALLFVAPLLAIASMVFFSASSAPKPATAVQARARVATEDGHVLPEPSSARAIEVVPSPAPSFAPAEPQNPTEASLTAAMHALEDSNPGRALELARQGLALWPAGPRAPEFAATEVKCLYRLGNPSEGRGAAEAMVNRYPTSAWALEVEKQTGAHPRVNH
jgi:hypothetical protein